jgi:beta-lactamase class D
MQKITLKMKRIVLIINVFLLLNLNVNCQSKNSEAKKLKETVVPQFQKILDSLKVKGSILIYDVNKNTYYSNDFGWEKNGNIPASTFKIPNSIIALETGIMKSDSAIFKWDGKKRRIKDWEKDLTLKEAFKASCVPCYQEVARKVGVKRMKEYLKKLNYSPNIIVDTLTIDTFWLEGESKITQMQQIDFLKRLYFSELPISKRTESMMKNIMEIEKTDNYVVRGKTGWGINHGVDNGWFVGYVEKKEGIYFFATSLKLTPETKREDFFSIRPNATKAALKNLKIIN